MTLDPKDWNAFRATAHKMLDASIDKLENASEGRVWTPLPEAKKAAIQTGLPVLGTSTDEMQKQLQSLLPYGVGNTHPRFFGWVHGTGAPSGLMADMAAAAMNVNAGGRDHVAPVVERQVLAWSAEMMGMPKETSGLIVSGTSMATIIALKVARDQAMQTVKGALVGYTSEQTHSCVAQAFDILGLGRDHLRKITCNDALEMDISALRAAIDADKAAGLTPFLIVGTAGAVNMGAIDDLEALADIAASDDMWFHIDGAFGATARIGQHAKDRLTGVARADSLAFDFHKWLQVNYDAGCVLIRDEAAHRKAFSDRPEYLRGSERGLAGGAFWAVDYGPELSRGFRALKVWAHLKEHGVAALAAVIDRNIEQAQYLENLVKITPELEMLAPVPLNICCFRYKFDADNDAKNEEIVVRLQESGIAVPSTTVLGGRLAIRVNLTNHRTRESDLDVLVDAVVRVGGELG
ncbi:MAG: cytochrome D ubiquinol oxidase subunit I [Amylibacter sp.]|nr:cytochrome D ubiquinol oxidase subunit I [Amylibacter sp.]